MVGASPSFSDVHVVRAILALENEKMGRKRLVKFLGLGEGSVRTILKKLKNQSLINSDRQGHELTSKGEKEVQKYLRKFSFPEKFPSRDLEGKFKVLTIVHNSSHRIKTGMEQRDTALNAGADGAILLVFKNKELEFPTPDISLSKFPDTKKRLKELRLNERDTVVISFGKTIAKAEDGAIAIALDLID